MDERLQCPQCRQKRHDRAVLRTPVRLRAPLHALRCTGESCRLAAAAARPVRRVAVVGGAGAEFIDTAVRRGADVYLTGDVKYHEAQRAAEQGMHLIDAGHFGTERPVLPVLADLLRAELAAEHGTVEIHVTETQRDVFDVII